MDSGDESDAEGTPPRLDSATLLRLSAKHNQSFAGSSKPNLRRPKVHGTIKTTSRTVTAQQENDYMDLTSWLKKSQDAQ